nr:MAG TPA: hypothetical protein [Caudoviricetes sp.]
MIIAIGEYVVRFRFQRDVRLPQFFLHHDFVQPFI